LKGARNIGNTIILSVSVQIAETCHKTWSNRALALDKDMLPRHTCNRRNRLPYQTNIFCISGM